MAASNQRGWGEHIFYAIFYSDFSVGQEQNEYKKKTPLTDAIFGIYNGFSRKFFHMKQIIFLFSNNRKHKNKNPKLYFNEL